MIFSLLFFQFFIVFRVILIIFKTFLIDFYAFRDLNPILCNLLFWIISYLLSILFNNFNVLSSSIKLKIPFKNNTWNDVLTFLCYLALQISRDLRVCVYTYDSLANAYSFKNGFYGNSMFATLDKEMKGDATATNIITCCFTS